MSPSRFPICVLLPAALALSLVACGGSEEASSEEADPSYRYSARGIVRQVPEPPGQELYIHHEEIPEFVNIDGEVQGMGAMAMPFPISDIPLPADLAAGDKVAFEFEVQWNGSPPMRLLSLEKLPPETVLTFEAATEEEGPADDPATEHEGHEGHDMQHEPDDPESHEGHEAQEGHEENQG